MRKGPWKVVWEDGSVALQDAAGSTFAWMGEDDEETASAIVQNVNPDIHTCVGATCRHPSHLSADTTDQGENSGG